MCNMDIWHCNIMYMTEDKGKALLVPLYCLFSTIHFLMNTEGLVAVAAS